MARPTKELNRDIFEELCSIQCTKKEIASVFRVDVDTVSAWCEREYGESFSTVYEKYSEDGKSSLRRTQFKLAERNPSMAIWLGKQYLNQRDRISNIVETDEESKELLKAYMEGVKLGESKENTES